ncbi:hypothetical protein LG290_08180 [Halomonas sediminis]
MLQQILCMEDGPNPLTFPRGCPVTSMAARVQPEGISYYLDLGASGMITKPFDSLMLASQINALWQVRTP